MMPSPQASFRAVLLAGTALLALPQAAGAQPAPNARPIGGAVVAGSAAISRSSSATTITQASQRAAINWQSFNVGAQQSVNFQQPNASAVALNRVIGPNPSQIAGRIDANGQVILINQDGITFYRGAQVNAAGFVASAAGMADKDFMAGRMAFTQPAHPGAAIVNAGTITVKQAGLAAFVAPQVANSGVITAKFGHVVLAGARTATLDLYGDGLVALDVTNQVTQTPGGATALVTNSGTILAQGGTVQLTARAADGLVQELVDAGGHISASASGAPGGTIVLDGIGGDIQVTGQLIATGTQGGQIAVLPSGTATLAATARLDASGTQGGGVVAVGTTLARAAGGPAVTRAARSAATVVQAGAQVAADATQAGDGGHVAVLSRGLTVMDGTLSAHGGAQGGNGGIVEASGNDLGFAGTIDVSAPAGAPGSVLFDPATLDIGSSTSPTITNPGSVAFSLDPSGTDTVDATALGGLTGNITLQAGTLLEVQQPVAFTKAVNVTLQSGGNLLVDAGVTLSAAAAASTLTLDAGATLSHSVGGTGGLAMSAGASIGGWSSLELLSHGGGIDVDGATLGASTLTIAAAGGGIAFGAAQITGVTLLDASAQGNVTQTTGTIAATTLQSSSGVTGNLLLTSSSNAIGTLNAVTAGGNITLDNTHDLTVAGALLTGGGSLTGNGVLDLTTTGGLTLGAGVTSTVVSLNAASIVQTGGIIATVSIDATASAGGITLASTGNIIGEIGNVTATGGDVVLADALNVTLDGAVGGNDIFIDAALAGGTLSIGAPAVTGPPATAAIPATLTLNAAGGRISLVADNLTETTGSALNSAGTVEIAPFSTGVAEVLGAAGSAGTLGVDATLLGEIGSASALVIGRVTAAGGLSGQTADGITIAGAVDLTGVATMLDLASTNGLSQAGSGTLTVGTLESSAGITGAISLAGSHNAIGTLGSFDAAGDIVTLVDTGSLTLAGPLSATAATFDVPTLSEAAGATVSLGTLAGSGTTFALAAAGNTIATLGSVTLSDDLTLAESGSLAVAGPVSAADATLSAGTLLVAGKLDVTTGTLALGSTGTVSESGATITAGTLAGSGTVGAGTIGGDLALGGGSNSIATLGSLTVVGNLTLADAHALSVSGPVGAANAALSAPTLSLAGSLDVGAGTLALGSSGTISETGASITAGTLAGFGTIGGDLLLDGTASSTNDIAALGSLKVGGNLTLADAAALTVAGAVSAGSAKTLLLQAAGAGDGIAIGIAGTPGTAGSLTGGTVSLTAAGAITEPDGTIAATTLSASAAAGAVSLGNTANTIAVADGITATGGDLVLTSASSMTLQDTLTGNDLTVTVAATSGTLNLGTALLSANAAGRISLVADTLTEHSGTGASLTATGGAVELAPFSTSEAFSLSTSGGTLSLDGAKLPSFTADTLTIGGITGTPRAASVTIAAGIDLTGSVATLDLLSRGAITDTKSLTVGTLLADAGGSIAIGSTLNTINVLGSVTAASLTLGDSASLTLDGPLSVTTATFNVPTLSEATGATVSLGTLAGSGTLFDLTSTQNSIATLGSVTLSGDLTLAEAGSLTVAGPVNAADATLSAGTLAFAGSLDVTTGTLALGSAGTVSETGATIIAGTLAGFGTIGGDLLLGGGNNSIATLGSLTVGGNLTLADAHELSVSGPVGATNAALSAPTLKLAGSLDVSTGTLALGSAGTISESGATLIAGTLAGFGTIGGDLALGDAASSNSIATLGSLTVGGNVTLADAQNLTLDGPLHVSAATFDAATLSEAAGAVVSLGTLAGSGTTFALTSVGNSIATLGAVTLGGDLTLAESGALSVAGPVAAADATLSAGTLAFVGNLSVGTGTLALGSTGTVSESGATITAGTLAGSGTVGAGTIGGDLALGGGNNSIATIGSLTVGSNVTLADVQPLTFDGPVSATAATFDVPVLSEAAGADVSLGTLAGSGVSFMLVAARNSIATLGAVTLSGDLTLAEVGALSIAGPVSAADATLSAGTLLLAGSLDVGTGTLALGSAGTVSETGATIIAGTLAGFGTIGGDLLLGGGSNSIATLGSLTVVGNLTLADAHELSVSGPVGATNATLSAPTLKLAGSLDVGAGTLALGSSGTVSETGATLIAGTLAGFGTIGGDLAFGGGSNSIATLGSLTVGNNVTLADTQPLTLVGPFSASRATLDNIASLHETGGATVSLGTLAGGGDGNFHLSAGHNSIAAIGSLALGGNLTLADTAPLSVDGPLTAASASLSAPSITLAGDVGAGTLALGSTGTVSQTGGVITAGQLTGDGTIGGDLSLAVATNSITSVGSVAVGGNATLADGVPLTIDGPFVATNATLGAPTLTLAGLVSLAPGGLLALADAGRVLETAAATLVAGTLAGTAAALDFSAGSNTLASIGNLGVTGTMTLVDTGSLAIAGAVTASAATIDAATLGIAGSVVAPSVVLTGGAGGIALGSAARVDGAGIALASVGPISFAGNAVLGDAAAAVALDVTGAGISEAPSSRILAASLLVPGVAGTADLAGTANAIATLSGFSATGDLVLEDGAAAALTLSGTVAAAGNVSIGDVAPPGLLTLAGTLTGTSVALASGSGGITLGGPIGATTLALATTGGGVQESGSPALNVGVLTSHGTIVGNVALGGAANSIGMLGLLLASGGVTLADAAALDITGPVEAASVTVTSPAALTLAGTLAASLVTLDAGGITLAAGALLEQANTVDLSSSAGISEAAAAEIATTTLFSSQGVTGAATLAGTANAVATLDGFSVQGGPLTLVDAAPLLIAGPVAVAGSAGTILAVTDPAGITVGGSIGASGGAVSLTAGAPGLTFAGAAQLAGAANVTLVSAGSIALAGAASILTPATLDVSAAGALTEATGARITTATLDSTGGLQNGASFGGTANSIATLGSMTVAGALALTDATALGVTGPVVAGSATIVTPAALSITGSLAATQATLTAGSIGLASGAVLGESGATLDLTTTAGGVAEAAGAQLLGAQLSSSGNIATNALLLGSANAVTALGPFAAGGTLEFIDAALLAVGGPVSATDVVLADAVGIAVGGPVTAAAALAVSTGAAGLLVAGGGVLAAPAIAVAGSGPISLAAGAVLGDPNAAIDLSTTAGGVAEAAGATITAASLTSNSGIAGNASFLGTANSVATLADMTATGTLALTDSTALALAGTIAAPLLLLATPGNVTEAGGAVLALQTLGSTGTIGGSVLLQSGVNAIGTLGGFAAAGALALTDNVPLTVAGPASAADIALTVPALDVTGTLAAATVLTLTAPAMTFTAGASISAPSITLADGGIIEDPAAVLAAQTLTSLGVITGAVTLVGTANVVSRLADFADADSLTLTDDTALTLAGLIAAPRIVIDTEGHPLTLAPGATIETGGQAAPTGAAFSDVVVPTASLGDAGAYLTVGSFTQTGSSYVTALGGSNSVLRIDAINAGSIDFDPVFGLYGQSTWLILGLTSGAGGTGSRATGNVFLKALTVVYPPGGGGVSADLFGTINEIGGQAAAGSGDVTPQPDSTVRLNNCALHSVDCVLLPVQSIPVANPLQNFDIGSMFNQNDDDDLLLPIVSDNDY